MGPKWGYLLQELGLGLRRNLLMTIATLVTTTVCLALLGTGLLIQKQVNLARNLFYAEVEVTIFLEDNISETQRASLEQALATHALVDTVLYESKDDAYAHFQEVFANQPDLAESVEPGMLPASFRIRLTDPEQFVVIQSAFAGYPGVQSVSDQSELLDTLFKVLRALRDGAVGIALLQALAAAALIANTIRLAAFARREQIGIMKLVGATNWYIRLPYLMEGVVAGVGGALLAGGVLLIADRLLIERMRELIIFMPWVGVADILTMVPLLLLIGSGISVIASFFSLRRSLAV
jgi:cell division transport system permease protein